MEGGLLHLDGNHISRHFADTEKDRVLDPFIRNLKLVIPSRVLPYLVEAGFGYIECTITLEDIAMRLGLPVDGDVISVISQGSWTTLCRDNLGCVPESFIGGKIPLNWLDANFQELSADASKDEIKMEMCGATDYRRNAIGGCLLLLQSWAWYRLPFLCPVVKNPFVFPLLLRKNHQELPDDLEKIRVLIDQKADTHILLYKGCKRKGQEQVQVQGLVAYWYCSNRVQLINSHPKGGSSRSLTISQISSLASGGSEWSPPEREAHEEHVISIVEGLSEDAAVLLSRTCVPRDMGWRGRLSNARKLPDTT
ncbi:hypothetical protein F3Y22_tig00110893pilonHSYRG01052 [Hibiscus syriacus]|uniref:Aminotransferase-like plant mobile domain-containing protein n=1 Tax=Hibiscus syriacus TaxID=106335 RepID=A0A6A2ZGG3_HIBSY|nr:hypothetical protein F3Y22_tig00110893pilonHSYRG01052 [Hibiscus syriacus]